MGYRMQLVQLSGHNFLYTGTVPYRDSCHFATVKEFTAATNF